MYPEVLKASYDAGHAIGIHTWSHPQLTSLTDDQIIAELVYGAAAIKEVIGVYPSYFRPPFGASDDRVLQLAATMGLTSIVWNFDSGDSDDTVDVSEDITNQVVPANFQQAMDQKLENVISLEHDMREWEARIAPQMMDLVVENGYNIMQLHKCINQADPYGNKILEGFFKSGQFNTTDKVLSPFTVTATPSKTSVSTTVLPSVVAAPLPSTMTVAAGVQNAQKVATTSKSNASAALISVCSLVIAFFIF
ncbi:hypothetical protein BC830DRAFT_35487 [Chytriomyces sp. MP71]|nr:hypothetical protein BC830DRAFT_35487 [Chytriomyces sp. MP71]